MGDLLCLWRKVDREVAIPNSRRRAAAFSRWSARAQSLIPSSPASLPFLTISASGRDGLFMRQLECAGESAEA
jgi:hypothetical protein